MRIYDLDTKEGRFYAYIEIHRTLREIGDVVSAKQVAEKLNGDPAQIAHALKKMAEYGGVHRREVQRRTDSTPDYAKFLYWNVKTWSEAMFNKFGSIPPAEPIASKRVILKNQSATRAIIRRAVREAKKDVIKRDDHGVDLSSLTLKQKQALFHELASELIPVETGGTIVPVNFKASR